MEHGPCRRTSNLAAAAIVGCIKAGSVQRGLGRPVRGHELCFQEVFAGGAVLSAAWRDAGVKVLEPIEVFEEPHLRRGYRESRSAAAGGAEALDRGGQNGTSQHLVDCIAVHQLLRLGAPKWGNPFLRPSGGWLARATVEGGGGGRQRA